MTTIRTEDLTPRQQEVLEVVRDIGQKPKLIGERLGITRNAAAVHLRNLRTMGAIPKSGKPRGRKPGSNGSNGHVDPKAIEIRHPFGAAASHAGDVDRERSEHIDKLGQRANALEDAITFHEDQAKRHADEAEAHKQVLEGVMHDIKSLAEAQDALTH